MQENHRPPLKRKKIKNKTWLHYFLLFAIVFSSALITLTYFVESYSPKVDVAIGNNESLTLVDDTEFKNVDERLKWIQMEDELPTVSIKDKITEKEDNKKKIKDEIKRKDLSKRLDKDEKKEKTDLISNNGFTNTTKIENLMKENEKNKITKSKENKKEETFEPKPILNTESPLVQNNKESRIVEKADKKNNSIDFRTKERKKTAIIEPVIIKNIPVSKPTKVYIGHFNTIEDAIKVQRKLSIEETDIVPFTKYINGQYTIQVGSFSDREKATALASRLKDKGYNSRYE